MKRLLIASLTILLLTCSGCIAHQGERPFDYPPARWVSETPDLWFDVYSFDEYANRIIELDGQLVLSEQSIDVIVWFNYTDVVTIRKKDSDNNLASLKGTCKFDPEKLIVTVDKETDTLLNGQYDTITFIRKPTE